MNYLEAIARESRLFREACTDLTPQVPSCPEWQVGDLVAHLGAVQRFHALHVVRGVTDQPTEHATIPDDDDHLLEWFDEGTQLLLDALRRTPDDTPAWNWSSGPQVAAFWPRRMALEAAVHRWDAQSATGTPTPQDPELAADGIDEVLFVHHDGPGTVRVELTDVARAWGQQKTPSAVLAGTAEGVFLGLWGRVPLESLSVEGDASGVAALRAG